MTQQWTRRSFVAASAATLAITQLSAEETSAASATGPLVYVCASAHKPDSGVYVGRLSPESGILVGRWNAATGTLSGYRRVSELTPGFLAVTHRGKDRFLFGGHSTGTPHVGGLSSFRIEPSGDLTLINTVTGPGTDFVHLACDHTGQCIVAPNYGNGSIVSARISPDGHLSEFVSHIQLTGSGPIADRQAGPHAHGVAISPNNRFAYINDLGTDRIMIYRLNPATAELTPAATPFFQLPPGTGPRHLAFHPNGKWAYSVNELNSTLTFFHWDTATGALNSIATTPTMKEGSDITKNRAGEIAFDRAGRFLYSCNRGGAEELPIYSVGPDGHLTFLAREPLNGKEARHFVVSPDDGYLLVANQFSNDVNVYTRNRQTGLLKPTDATYPAPGASCVLFV